MGGIILPRPDNVRGRYGTYVDSDVFNIAERIRTEVESGERLHIEAIDPPIHWQGRTYNFAIVEDTLVGPRLVMRVKELDARVITDLQRMIRIPFEKRFEEAEKLADKLEKEEQERQLDLLYERMGGNMWTQLERCGFIDRPVSYAKRNATAMRHRRHRQAKGLIGVPAR